MKALELASKILSGEVEINTSSQELQELDSWSKERRGKFTASNIYMVCASDKSGTGLGETAKKYVRDVFGERFGDEKQNFTSDAMQLGIDNEPICAEILAKKYENFKHLGKDLFKHPTIENTAASPDFTCTINGIYVCGDIKTATTVSKFLEYVDASNDNYGLKKISKQYYYQVQWQIECVGASQGLLVAFCPALLNTEYDCIKTFYIEKDATVIQEIKDKLELCEQYGLSLTSKLKTK